MIGEWTAASVRARGLAFRRVGRTAARSLANAASLSEALATLSHTPYDHDVRADMDLATAERAVSATFLWHLRVLSGWSPSRGQGRVRLLAAGFEIANIAGKLAELDGRAAVAPYDLGAFAMAWAAVSRASNSGGVRAALAASVWGDPGGTDLPAIVAALQVTWARRVAAGAPEAAYWAKMFGGVLLARMIAGGALPDPGSAMERDLHGAIGGRWTTATTLADLPNALSMSASHVLDPAGDAESLWRAEARAWLAVEEDALRMQRGWKLGPGAIVAAAGLLAVDAWRVRAALEFAARGGRPAGEMLDVVA